MKAVPYIVMVLFCISLLVIGQIHGSMGCKIGTLNGEIKTTTTQVKSDEKIQQKVIRMRSSDVTKQLLSKWMRD